MSIGKKLFMAITVVMVLVIVIVVTVNGMMVKSALEKRINTNMQNYGETIAANLDEMLQKSAEDLKVVRAHDALLNFFTYQEFEDEDAMVEEAGRIEAFVLEIMAAKPNIAIMQFVSKNQVFLHMQAGESVETDKSFSFNSSLPKSLTEEAFFIEIEAENIMLYTAVALVWQDNPVGTLWSVQKINNRLQLFMDDLQSHDFSGLIFDAQQEFIRTKNNLPSKNDHAWLKKRITLKEAPWTIAIYQPEQVAFALLSRLQQVSLITVLLSLSAGLVLLWLLVNMLVIKPLNLVTERMQQVSEGDGDLTLTLPSKGDDELARLASAFNIFIKKLHVLITNDLAQIEKMHQAISELNQLEEEAHRGVDKQSQQIVQVATAMEEMTHSINCVSDDAKKSMELTDECRVKAAEGKNIIGSTVNHIAEAALEVNSASEGLEELQSKVKGIGTVLEVIQGISEQTNLLALNAAIEAARAGEQGRGFAVVADEVRSLAGRTKGSTQQIESIIKELEQTAQTAASRIMLGRDKTQQGQKVADEAGMFFNQINESIEHSANLNSQISQAADEQSTVSSDINVRVNQINQLAEDSSALTDKTRLYCQKLHHLAEELQEQMSHFKV